MKKLISVILISSFAICYSGCNIIQKTPEAIKKQVVAKFGSEKITKGEFDSNPSTVRLLSQYKTQYGSDFESNATAAEQLKTDKKSVLEQIVMEKILKNKADELKVVDDTKALQEDVDKQFTQMKEMYKDDNGKVDESKFAEDLKQAGYTQDSLKEYIKLQILASKVYDKETKDVKPTDKEIQDYYNNNMSSYTEKQNRVHVAHILVKTEAEAKKVKARLDAGEDFTKVAKEVSIDTGSKVKGGDLGFINYNDSNYDNTFMLAAQALKDGQISVPINTQFGWHIIKCIKNESYPVKKLSEVKSDVTEKVTSQLKQTKWNKILAQWKKDADIKIYEKNF